LRKHIFGNSETFGQTFMGISISLFAMDEMFLQALFRYLKLIVRMNFHAERCRIKFLID